MKAASRNQKDHRHTIHPTSHTKATPPPSCQKKIWLSYCSRLRTTRLGEWVKDLLQMAKLRSWSWESQSYQYHGVLRSSPCEHVRPAILDSASMRSETYCTCGHMLWMDNTELTVDNSIVWIDPETYSVLDSAVVHRFRTNLMDKRSFCAGID